VEDVKVGKTQQTETEAERIAKADADIAAGRLIDEQAMDAWIDSLGTDHELPLPQSGIGSQVETEAERRHRLDWEAERIAEAEADVAAGRLVNSAKVKAWIDSIGTDGELPVPYSDR